MSMNSSKQNNSTFLPVLAHLSFLSLANPDEVDNDEKASDDDDKKEKKKDKKKDKENDSNDKKAKKVKAPAGGIQITAKVSHYWPPLGGTNCGSFVNGTCVSNMASGRPWSQYVEKAIACPASVPFGTKIYVLGEEWECLDRGGAIRQYGNTYWIDMLTPNARVPFGAEVPAIMVYP